MSLGAIVNSLKYFFGRSRHNQSSLSRSTTIVDSAKPKLQSKGLTLMALFLLFSCNALAADAPLKDYDRATSSLGLFNAAIDSTKYDAAIKLTTKHINSLEKSMSNLDAKLGKYKWNKSSTNKYIKNTKAGKEGIKALSKQIAGLESAKLKKINSLKKLNSDLKFSPKVLGLKNPNYKMNVKNATLVKVGTSITKNGSKAAGKVTQLIGKDYLAKLGKVGTGAAVLGTAVSLVDDYTKREERIKQGSSDILENLMIGLKVVEFYQPTIPFTATPSDVARAMIDLKAASTSRDKSFSNAADSLRGNINSMLDGEASFEAYLYRNYVENSDFKEDIRDNGAESAYNNLKKKYLKDSLAPVMQTAFDLTSSAQKKTDNAMLDASEGFYASIASGAELGLQRLNEKSSRLRNYDDGLDMVKGFEQILKAKERLSASVITVEKETLDLDRKMLTATENNIDNYVRSMVSTAISPQQVTNKPVPKTVIVKKPTSKVQKKTSDKQRLLSDSKLQAEALRQENMQLAEAFEKDSNNTALQNQLNASAQAYLDLRASIRETEPDFGFPIDTAGTVSKRLNKDLGEEIITDPKNKKLAVQEKVNRYNKKVREKKQSNTAPAQQAAQVIKPTNGVDKKRNAERKRLIAQLSQKVIAQQKAEEKQFAEKQADLATSLSNKLSEKQRSRNAKQLELDKLKSLQNRTESTYETVNTPGSTQEWVDGNSEERDKLMELVENLRLIKVWKNKSNKSYSELSDKLKGKLETLTEQLGVRNPKFVYEQISRFYTARNDKLADMPIKAGHFKTVDSTQSYTQKVNKLVGLTSSEKNRKLQLEKDISDFDLSFDSLQNELNETLNQQYTASAELKRSKNELGGLVSDVLDFNKAQIATTQGNQSQLVFYDGTLSSANNGLTTHARFESANGSTTVPTNGMNMLNPQNNGGVFSGAFTTAGKTNGTYSYVSWGKWNATNPAQTYTEPNGNVTALAGGHWVMEKAAFYVPRQGSATFTGQLAGDYQSAAGVRTADVMSGTVTLNANFGTATISGSANIQKSGTPWANAAFGNGPLRFEQLDATAFNANLTGGASGGIHGTFAGANGQMPTEVGGGWWLRKADNSGAAGIFRAKR